MLLGTTECGEARMARAARSVVSFRHDVGARRAHQQDDLRPPPSPNPKKAKVGLLNTFFGPPVADLPGPNFVERSRHRFVRVDAIGQRRRPVVELLRALRHNIDEGKFRIDVFEKAVEIAENGVAHLGFFQFFDGGVGIPVDAEAFGSHDRFEIIDRLVRVRLLVDDEIVETADVGEFLMGNR